MTSDAPPDFIDQIRGATVFFTRARWVQRVVFGLVFASLAVGSFSDIQLGNILRSGGHSSVISISLAIYYVSWIFGMDVDLRIQQATYLFDPDKGKMTLDLVSTAFFLTVAGVLIFLTRTDVRYLAGAITIFTAVCVYAIFPVQKAARPKIAASRDAFLKRKNFIEFAKLNTVDHYICGNWIWIRSPSMVLLLLVVDFLCFCDRLQSYVLHSISHLAPSFHILATDNLLPSLVIFIYIVVGELWQWIMRIRTSTKIKFLDELGRSYELSPIVPVKEIVDSIRPTHTRIEDVVDFIREVYDTMF